MGLTKRIVVLYLLQNGSDPEIEVDSSFLFLILNLFSFLAMLFQIYFLACGKDSF